MKYEALNWIDKLIYVQKDTMPDKKTDPEVFKKQSAEVRELKKIKKWLLSVNP